MILDPINDKTQQVSSRKTSDTHGIKLNIPAVSVVDAGKYVCMVIGSQGEIDEKAAYLYVRSSET